MSKNLIDIDHLAKLARMNLTEEEKATIAPQLEDILGYVSKLSEVDTSSVSASAYINDAVNVWRDDVVEVTDDATKKLLISAFPKSVGPALQVPGIFESRTE